MNEKPNGKKKVKLQRDDYFELRARSRDCEAIRLEAEVAAAGFRLRFDRAAAVKNALWERIAEEHGLDPARDYGFNDDTLTLEES